MAVLLAFELTSHQAEVREQLLEAGFLNSMVGYHTRYNDEIQSDLPSNLLYHPSYADREALSDLREVAKQFGIDIDDRQQRAFAIGIEPRGATSWRGIVSRFHPTNEE